MLFILSTFFPSPYRFYLWGVALLASLFLPLVMFNMGKINPQAQAEIDIVSEVHPSLVERFGLFTIIVLGEVVVGVAAGVSEHHHFNGLVGGTAALGTLIATGLWWVYFDPVSHHLPRPRVFMVSAWFYFHLPMTMGIAAVGAAVLNVVEHAGEPLPPEILWLLLGAISITLISIALLTRTIQLATEQQQAITVGARVMLLSAVLIILLGFLSLNTVPLLIAVILLLLAPIFFGLKVWIALQTQEA